MKALGRWTWQCNRCETVVVENEWRGNEVRVMPKCERCGALEWDVLKVDLCPVGLLFLGDEVGL